MSNNQLNMPDNNFQIIENIVAESVKKEVDAAKKNGKRIVLVTGVFDLLHKEHRRFLAAAKQAGDFLVVGIEADIRVKQMKGNDRPLQTEQQRVQQVADVSDVDLAFLLPADFNSQQHYESLIAILQPSILAVSAHSPHQDKKKAILEKYSGEVRVVREFNANVSTTKIVADLNPKGVLIDVDGTILQPNYTIAEEEILAVREVQRCGLAIGLCTGRQAAALHYIWKKLNIVSTHVVAGGAQIVKVSPMANKLHISVVWQQLISPADLSWLLKKVDSLGGEPVAGTLTKLYGNSNFVNNMQSHPWQISVDNIDNLSSAAEVSLVSVQNPNAKFLEFAQSQTKLHAVIMLNSRGMPYVDITAAGVSKLTGARQWAKINNISVSDIMAIGDGANDLEYLPHMGVSVAMGNAVMQLQDNADIIVASNKNHGVAQTINLALKNSGNKSGSRVKQYEE